PATPQWYELVLEPPREPESAGPSLQLPGTPTLGRSSATRSSSISTNGAARDLAGRDGTRPSQEPESASPRCTLRKPRPWDCRAPARQRNHRLHKCFRLTPQWYELVLEPPRGPSLSPSAATR